MGSRSVSFLLPCVGAGLAVLVSTLVGCTTAQTPDLGHAQSNVPAPEELTPSDQQAAAASTASNANVHQDALDALNRMADSLRTLSRFEVSADTSADVVLDNGQNAQHMHHVVLKVRRPDRLRADISNGTGATGSPTRGLVYDGRNFTVFNTTDGNYSRNPAPPTIDELVRQLASTYDFEAPLTELFYWDTGKVDDLALTSARNLGVEKIGARTCTHYAFQQQGTDWELWLEQGQRPLPCRMVITDTTKVSRPRHSATYQWNLHPSLANAVFNWRPRANMNSVDLTQGTRAFFQDVP